MILLLALLINPEPKIETKYSPADYNRSAQALCKIEKGSYEHVRKALKTYKFRILLKSRGDTIAITWDKPLTEKDLTRLLSIKGVESVELDTPRVERIFTPPTEVKE